MSSNYILVSLPLRGSKDDTWKTLQDKITTTNFDTQVYRLYIPDLRVGTLDSLLALSDDLIKANAFVEGVNQKLKRQIEELDRVIGGEASSLLVDGVPIESYITRFAWDEAKYPLMNHLRETVDSIHETVSKLEDDLKVRVAEYNSVKSQLSALNRKAGGSLLVKDVSPLVSSDQVINTEHMTTLLVVVSKFQERDWLNSYETLSTFVVPRSSQKLTEDGEYSLFSVVLFRKVVDNFKSAARDKGFQVREFEFDPEGVKSRQEELNRLSEDQEVMRNQLHLWCNTSYGEVFSSWLHIAAIRVFTESILRYGLPPAYLSAVLALSGKNEKKVRAVLDSLSSSDDSSFWASGDGDSSLAGLTGGDADFHPYVSVSISLV